MFGSARDHRRSTRDGGEDGRNRCCSHLLNEQKWRLIFFRPAGINERNVVRTLHGAVSVNGKGLDGVAVVSAIMGSTEPAEAARALSSVTKDFKSTISYVSRAPSASSNSDFFIHQAASLLSSLRNHSPLVHQVSSIARSTSGVRITENLWSMIF